MTGVFLIFALFGPVYAQEGRSRAVVIGVRRYAKYPPTRPLLYSDNDASHIREFISQKSPARFEPRDISVLTDEKASLNAMKIAFRKALLGAANEDYVYLFISARGIALPASGDGYLGNADLIEIKPESTGLAIEWLYEWIRDSRAKRVFLFADVCRDPPSLPFENRINLRLEKLGAISKFAGIVASEREGVSFEKKDLPPRTSRGLGVFAYVLIDRLPANGTSLASVFEGVKKMVPTVASPNRQIPKQVGRSVEARTGPLWLARAGRAAQLPALLASAGFSAGLLAPLQLRAGEELFTPERLANPESLVQEIENQQGKTSSDDWEDLRDRTAAALADNGQRVVAAYGIEDLLPEDPRRQRPEHFRLAARSFAAAVRLLPADPRFESYRRELEGLAEFCTGRALAFDTSQLTKARATLESARRKMPKPIPEIDNAIGITYLEGGEFAAAAEHFKAAKRASPSWPYPRHNLALAFAEQGNYRAAEREYRDAIRFMPDQPYLRYNLGLLLQKMNRKKQARAEINETITRLGAAAKNYTERSKEWSKILPDESALARDRAALMLRARGEAENVLGAIHESLGEFEQAEAAFRRALSAYSELCPARHNLALFFERHKRGDPRALLEENVDRCASFHPSIVLLAQLRLRLGLRDLARQGFERALAVAPQNAESALELARILVADGQPDRAAEILMNSIRRTEPVAHPLLHVELVKLSEAQASPHLCDTYRGALQALQGTAYDTDRKRIQQKVKQCGK
jgi:Tfp pilus assembly protein PilF